MWGRYGPANFRASCMLTVNCHYIGEMLVAPPEAADRGMRPQLRGGLLTWVPTAISGDSGLLTATDWWLLLRQRIAGCGHCGSRGGSLAGTRSEGTSCSTSEPCGLHADGMPALHPNCGIKAS